MAIKADIKFIGRVDIIDSHNKRIIVWDQNPEQKANELSAVLGWPITNKKDGLLVIEHPKAHTRRYQKTTQQWYKTKEIQKLIASELGREYSTAHIRRLAPGMGDVAKNESGSGWIFTIEALDFFENRPKPGPKGSIF